MKIRGQQDDKRYKKNEKDRKKGEIWLKEVERMKKNWQNYRRLTEVNNIDLKNERGIKEAKTNKKDRHKE